MKRNKFGYKKTFIWKGTFGLGIIILGLIFNYLNLGKNFLGFNSVGNWLIYVGILSLVIVGWLFFSRKKRKVDERSQFIGMKSSRNTYIAIILFLFGIMILDGIKTINWSYSSFASAFICGITLVYLISYKILERRY